MSCQSGPAEFMAIVQRGRPGQKCLPESDTSYSRRVMRRAFCSLGEHETRQLGLRSCERWGKEKKGRWNRVMGGINVPCAWEDGKNPLCGPVGCAVALMVWMVS